MLQTILQKQESLSGHAYVCFGDVQQNLISLKKYLGEDLDISLVNNPDLFVFDLPKIGIGEVRRIGSIVARTNISAGSKVIILAMDSITIEAQNAFLKTLEEPASPTLFYILVPSGTYLLDTIISRTQQIYTEAVSQVDISQYLNGSYADRMELLKTFYKEDESGKEKIQKGELVIFLTTLEQQLVQLVTNKAIEPAVYSDVVDMTQYVLDRSANVKQIFEYICLRIPTQK